MFIVCENFSGNTGKSTITDNLLLPRLKNCKVLRIETINTHNGDAEQNMTGKQYGDIADGIVLFDNAVVDVGASNAEVFHHLMQQYKGSHEIWDYFVVPVIPSNKQIEDTIKTIESLSSAGVDPDRIKVIFNRVENSDVDIEKIFGPIFAFHQQEGKFTLNKNAVVYEHEFFARAEEMETDISQVLSDKTDFNSMIRKSETADERISWSRKRALKWLATDLNEKLDAAFTALFGEQK